MESSALIISAVCGKLVAGSSGNEDKKGTCSSLRVCLEHRAHAL